MNNPFKIGDKVYHYSTGEKQHEITCFSHLNGFAYLNLNPISFSISELSFNPYDLINGGLTHQRPVDFSILNDTDWFYVKTFRGNNEWYFKGNMFIADPKNIACSTDKLFKDTGSVLTQKENVVFLRKCTKQELEEIKTIFPEEFCKPKTLFERIEHEIKMSLSCVSGIIISDEEGTNSGSECVYDFRVPHECRSIPIYRSKTNMPKGKIILF